MLGECVYTQQRRLVILICQVLDEHQVELVSLICTVCDERAGALDLPLAFAPPFQLHPDLRTFNSSGKPLLKQFSIEVVFYIGSLTRPSSRGTLLFKVLCFPKSFFFGSSDHMTRFGFVGLPPNQCRTVLLFCLPLKWPLF